MVIEEIEEDFIDTHPADVFDPGGVIGAGRMNEIVVLLKNECAQAMPAELLSNGLGRLGLAASRFPGDGHRVAALLRWDHR